MPRPPEQFIQFSDKIEPQHKDKKNIDNLCGVILDEKLREKTKFEMLRILDMFDSREKTLETIEGIGTSDINMFYSVLDTKSRLFEYIGNNFLKHIPVDVRKDFIELIREKIALYLEDGHLAEVISLRTEVEHDIDEENILGERTEHGV